MTIFDGYQYFAGKSVWGISFFRGTVFKTSCLILLILPMHKAESVCDKICFILKQNAWVSCTREEL